MTPEQEKVGLASFQDLTPPERPNWCPNCGNFGILSALKTALIQLKIDPSQVLLVSGIGCSSKLPHWINTYGFHSIHGRGLPVAQGAKLANHDLTVIAVGGDGDGYGIGMNHFVHAIRRNINITYLVHNNQVYGLTKGQTSPTSEKGFKSKTSPFGKIEEPSEPLRIALSAGSTFEARGFAGDLPHLTEIIKRAITHEGFAHVDILQPCVTFNYLNTYEFFRKNTYKLEESGDYVSSDKTLAYAKAGEWEKGIPLGVLYQDKDAHSYEDHLEQLDEKPLSKIRPEKTSINNLLREFY